MIRFTYDDVRKLSPCAPGFKAATVKLGGMDAWNANPASFDDLLAAGVSHKDITWLANAHNGDADYNRRLSLWVADCVAHTIHIFHKNRPDDDRPSKAIEASRAFARGEIDDAAKDAAGAAAWRASEDATKAAAEAAAWAAAEAVSVDFYHAATESANTAASWNADEAASEDAAEAASEDAAEAAERKWQVERLILWMSDNEPEDWPVHQEGAV